MRAMTLLAALVFGEPALPPMPAEPPRSLRPTCEVRAEKTAAVLLDLKLPNGWRLHPAQKFVYRIAQTTGVVKLDPSTRKGYLDKPKFPIKVPFTPPAGPCEVLLQVAFYYCPKEDLLGCKAFSRYYLLPITGTAASKNGKIALRVEPD